MLVFYILEVMASLVLLAFLCCYHDDVYSKAYLGQNKLLAVGSFQVLRCQSDSVDPRWHSSTQEIVARIARKHIL